MNAGSSRSHCVVYLVVERVYPDGRKEFGKLCLVVSWQPAPACLVSLPNTSFCCAASTFLTSCALHSCALHDMYTVHRRNRCGPLPSVAPPAPPNPFHPALAAALQDLAGSERQDKTGAAGTTLAEGSQINKSLRCVGGSSSTLL